MPRLRYIEESEKSPHTRELIESAKRTGAPDPRVVSLMTRSHLGVAWVEYWNKLLYQGILPHKLKELCRIKMSVAHQCGYCSTVRSTVAKAEGLTEDIINDLFDYAVASALASVKKRRCIMRICLNRANTPSTRTKFIPISLSTSAMKRSSSSGCSVPRSMAWVSSSNRSTC